MQYACISVVDAFGNVYQSTYPKRAKGLVRKGRARFVDEKTICLTCPPDIREAFTMTPSTPTPMNLTAAEIFAELQKIRQDTSHMQLAMEKLEKVPTGADQDSEICQKKIEAVQKVAQEREITNQALIRLYEKMYDDIYYRTEDSDENKTVQP